MKKRICAFAGFALLCSIKPRYNGDEIFFFQNDNFLDRSVLPALPMQFAEYTLYPANERDECSFPIAQACMSELLSGYFTLLHIGYHNHTENTAILKTLLIERYCPDNPGFSVQACMMKENTLEQAIVQADVSLLGSLFEDMDGPWFNFAVYAYEIQQCITSYAQATALFAQNTYRVKIEFGMNPDGIAFTFDKAKMKLSSMLPVVENVCKQYGKEILIEIEPAEPQ